jgi:hypothetical protein
MISLRFIQPFGSGFSKYFHSASVRLTSPIKLQTCNGIPMYERNQIFEWLLFPVVWPLCFRYFLKSVFISTFQFNIHPVFVRSQNAGFWVDLWKKLHSEWISTRNWRRFLLILRISSDETRPHLTQSHASSRTHPHKVLRFLGVKPFHAEISILVATHSESTRSSYHLQLFGKKNDIKYWHNNNAENCATIIIEKEIPIENLQHSFSPKFPDHMSRRRISVATSVRNCLLTLRSGLRSSPRW